MSGTSSRAIRRDPLFQERATNLVNWLSTKNLTPARWPDEEERMSKAPDVAFVDSDGVMFVVEVTRLLDSDLLKVERFARGIANALRGRLPWSYLLQVRLDQLPPGGIPRSVHAAIIEALMAATSSEDGPNYLQPMRGYELHRLDAPGMALYPQLVAPDLAPDPHGDEQAVILLRRRFRSIVIESDGKFRWNPNPPLPHRLRRNVLLVGIEQTGLDWEYHVQPLGGRPSLMGSWLDGLQTSSRFEIYVEPGVRIWQEDGLGVRAGTRYDHQGMGLYLRLQPPPIGLVRHGDPAQW